MSRGDNLPATGWFRGEGRPAPWPGAARGGGNALRHIVGDQGDRAVVLNAARRRNLRGSQDVSIGPITPAVTAMAFSQPGPKDRAFEYLVWQHEFGTELSRRQAQPTIDRQCDARRESVVSETRAEWSELASQQSSRGCVYTRDAADRARFPRSGPMPQLTPRQGMSSPRLNEAEFRKRFLD